MKEERMAVLSMVEKGIISVDEAERLLQALENQSEGEFGRKVGRLIQSTGEGLGILALKIGEKTERLVASSKEAAKKTGSTLDKVVEEKKPRVKKAAPKMSQKAEELNESIRQKREARKKDLEEEYEDLFADLDDDYEAEEDDFEEDVTVIPFRATVSQDDTQAKEGADEAKETEKPEQTATETTSDVTTEEEKKEEE